MIIFDLFKDKIKLATENMNMRKSKFEVEQERNKLNEELAEIQTKYIELLEAKSNQFDLYVKYQNQCVELANEKRELKKQCAETKEALTSSEERNISYEKEVQRLKRKIKRLENELE